MATYEIELEDGSKYQIETEDAASASTLDASNIPTPSEPEGGYGERFVGAVPGAVEDVMRQGWQAISHPISTAKSIGSAVYNAPSSFYKWATESSPTKIIGDVGSTAARVNPLFFITGPAYDKLLQSIDPETFPPTSPEQDARKVVGETVMGAAPLAGATIARDLLKGGGYLAKSFGSKLANRPASFKEVLTPAVLDKSLKATEAFEDVSSLEKAMQREKPFLEGDPRTSYKNIRGTKLGLIRKAERLADDAGQLEPSVPGYTKTVPILKESPLLDAQGKPIVQTVDTPISVPPRYEIATPKAQQYIDDIADPFERMKAQEYLDMKRAGLEADPKYQGSIRQLHEYKQELYKSNPSAYQGGKTTTQAAVDRALASDINEIIRGEIPGEYQAVNARIKDLMTLQPTARRRYALDKLGKTVRGDWTNVLFGPNNMDAGIISRLGGGTANIIGQVGKGLGAGGEALSKALDAGRGVAASPSLLGTMASITTPFLPRNTDQFGDAQLASFLIKATSTPQAPIAQDLVKKFQKAKKDGDITTVEKLHSDMARLFPDFFEPGQGVNGKLFYQDEQVKAMDLLKELHRLGQVDSIQLAKQKNAFNNSQDGRILPVTLKRHKYGTPTNSFVNGTRTYPY